MRALFTLTIFLGSFLLFLVQPMVAKMILPTFGGSPQVWSAAMLFFQVVLLLGYLYAHRAPQALGVARHSKLHLVLFVLAAFTLPFGVSNPVFQAVQRASVGQDASVSLWVLLALGGLVGLPFFILSSGSSLLQRWFARSPDPSAKDPYFLYSASNVGSLLGLFAYPFVLEPRLTVPLQSRVWMGGYLALAVLVALCAFRVRPYLQESEGPEPETQEPAKRTAPRTRLLWILLAAAPSSLMLGVTTYLTSNIAPVPLLWIIPLSLYLATFILAFGKVGAKPLENLGRLLPLVATPLSVAIILDVFPPELAVLLGFLHLAVFFVAAWMCHTRLVSLRPPAARLTEFYFYMAVGGAVGGAFNSLVAPVIFDNFHEYAVALVGACLLRPRAASAKGSRFDLVYPVVVVAVMVLLVLVAKSGSLVPIADSLGISSLVFRTVVTIGIPLVLCFLAVDRVMRFGLALGGVFLVATVMKPTADSQVLLTERSFYGVHRVTTHDERFVRLVHGNTIHGLQDRQNPAVPLTYYHPTGPVGQIFDAYFDRMQDVALVGLGVGSIAAYGRLGMRMTFYEIDPVVDRIAKDSRYFTFLKDSKAEVDVVVGDARLTLSRSDRKFDLIVLDAFSSDTIPVHLLTREAMAMYLGHLKPNGLLAFHISNRYLVLEDTLAAIGKSLGLYNVYQMDPALPDEAAAGKQPSSWMAFSPSKAEIEFLAGSNGQWGEQEPMPGTKVWTDDYSNVLSVFDPNQ